MSALFVTSFGLIAASGDMYFIVPIPLFSKVVSTPVDREAWKSPHFITPKSPSFAYGISKAPTESVRKMLAGLISRCTRRFECRSSIALVICRAMWSRSRVIRKCPTLGRVGALDEALERPAPHKLHHQQRVRRLPLLERATVSIVAVAQRRNCRRSVLNWLARTPPRPISGEHDGIRTSRDSNTEVLRLYLLGAVAVALEDEAEAAEGVRALQAWAPPTRRDRRALSSPSPKARFRARAVGRT